MIQIQDTIISDEVFDEHFICDLGKCKGACCVEGDAGAPVEEEEIEQINSILPEIWNDLLPMSKALIEKQGIAYEDYDGEMVTSIVNGRECVFVYYEEDGTAKCAIERAYREGRISVRKPISCHLYPIRLQKFNDFTAVNYHRWSICRPAIKLGKKEGVKIYQFLKEPLIRKFGQAWYDEVCEAAKLMEEE